MSSSIHTVQLKDKFQAAVKSVLSSSHGSQSQSRIELNNGVKMPSIGLGTGCSNQREQDTAQQWFESALTIGYRHLDTAFDYGTEPAVGRAVRASGIPREEIFITTKLPYVRHIYLFYDFYFILIVYV